MIEIFINLRAVRSDTAEKAYVKEQAMSFFEELLKVLKYFFLSFEIAPCFLSKGIALQERTIMDRQWSLNLFQIIPAKFDWFLKKYDKESNFKKSVTSTFHYFYLTV